MKNTVTKKKNDKMEEFIKTKQNKTGRSHGQGFNQYRYTLKIELPYDPSIALLDIYPKDTDVVKRRAIDTPMFIAAMAIIAKLWKELRCPSTDEWVNKMWSIYTMEY